MSLLCSCAKGIGGKSTHVLYISRRTDTYVEILIQLLYSSKSNKVQVVKCTQSIKVKSFPLKKCFSEGRNVIYNAKAIELRLNELIVESHSQNVKMRHFGSVKRPKLSQKDKNIQTEVTSLFGKCNEEKVQIFAFKCGEKYRNKVFVLHYFPSLAKSLYLICL